jgi:hypothetical protein
MLADAWNSVVAIWNYLMGMPQAAATGLILSTTIVVVLGLIVWAFKRSTNLLFVAGPLILVGVAYAFWTFGDWVHADFFIDLMKIFSLLAFLWAVVALFLTLVSRRPLK